MLDLVRRVGGEFGISIVISTHLMGDVERACDSVVVLDAGRLLRTGAVSGFTEETETLEVEFVERASAVADGLQGRGLEPRLDGSRLTLERVSGEYDMLRDVIVDSGALLYRLAPARDLPRTSSRAIRAKSGRNGRARSRRDVRACRVFDRLPGLRGSADRPLGRRRAIWRDGIGSRSGSGADRREDRAWLLLGLALVPVVVLVVVSRVVGPATDPDDFELPSYSEYYEWAMVPLRSSLRSSPRS